MTRLTWADSKRPNFWLLGPVGLSIVMHVIAHKDFLWMAACFTLILSSYFTDLEVPWPQWKKHWPRILVWFGLLWMLAYLYFEVWMKEGLGLRYFPRFLFKPWLVTRTSLLAATMLTYIWHVSFRRRGRGPAILLTSGYITLCSAQFLGLPRLYSGCMILYCLSLALAFFFVSAKRESMAGVRLPKPAYLLTFVLWLALVGVGSWSVVFGLRKIGQNLPQILGQFFRPLNFSGHLGSRESMMIRRQQRIRLSSVLVASIEGKREPGYLRTQVMTRYKRGLWSSARTEFPLKEKEISASQKAFTLPLLQRGKRRPQRNPLLRYRVQVFQQMDHSMLLSYGTRRFVTAKGARCLIRMGHSVSCEPPRHLEEYSFLRRLGPALTLGIGQASLERDVPKNLPGMVRRMSLKDKQRLEEIYRQLRPFALRVVGKYRSQPLLAAQVMQSYFRQNYKYSLQVKLAPKGDPTVDFVLHKRPAFCEYFASGMALSLRSIGIKARVASGFVVKEFHESTKRWLIRQRDAHAWTEVYDAPNRRWVAFDPTSPNSISRLEVGGLQGFFDRWKTSAQLRWQQFVAWLRRVNYREWLTQKVSLWIGQLWRWQSALFLLCLWMMFEIWQARLSLWNWLLRLGLPFLPEPKQEESVLPPHREQIQGMMEEMLEDWAQQGVPILSGETVEEFLARLKANPLPEAQKPSEESIQALLRLYNHLRFSPVGQPGSLSELEQRMQECRPS